MNFELLKMLNPFAGKANKERASMNLICSEVEKKVGPIKAFDMAVDFETEKIIFEVKEKGIKENISHPLLFMMIENITKAELDGNVKLIALIVNFEKDKPFPATSYYEKDGQKLHTTKTIN